MVQRLGSVYAEETTEGLEPIPLCESKRKTKYTPCLTSEAPRYTYEWQVSLLVGSSLHASVYVHS